MSTLNLPILTCGWSPARRGLYRAIFTQPMAPCFLPHGLLYSAGPMSRGYISPAGPGTNTCIWRRWRFWGRPFQDQPIELQRPVWHPQARLHGRSAPPEPWTQKTHQEGQAPPPPRRDRTSSLQELWCGCQACTPGCPFQEGSSTPAINTIPDHTFPSSSLRSSSRRAKTSWREAP